MSVTVQQVVDAAYGYSFKNRPDTIATSATELVGVVDRKQKQVFADVAAINPMFFGTALIVAFSSSGWTLPSDAELIWRIERSDDGTEVITVPLDDRGAEPLKAAVYQRANRVYPAGNPLDPTSGSLTFFYTRAATTLALLADNLDPLFPDRYQSILVLDLAAYLADKDGRPNEGSVWRAEGQRWEAMLARLAEQQISTEVRRTGFPRRTVTKRIAPATGSSKVG